MTRISNKLRFAIKESPDLTDYIIGSDSTNNNATVNFEVGSLLNEAAGGGLPDEIIYGTYEWIEGTLSFNIFEIKFRKNGFLYLTDPVTITLDEGNTLPRKDVIAVTTDEEVVVIKGTPSADPAVPVLPDYTEYLSFTVVDIAALATVPTDASKQTIYKEGVEWTPTDNTGNTNIQVLSTVNPYEGSKSIRLYNAVSGDSFKLTNSSKVTVNLLDTLNFRLYLSEALGKREGFRIKFYNGNTVVSSTVRLSRNRFNYNNTLTGVYQYISIPFSEFVFSDVEYDKVEFTLVSILAPLRLGRYPLMYVDNIIRDIGITIPTLSIKHSDVLLDDGTNPHGTTAGDVGLGDVDNTSDVNKPVSFAQQLALDLKLNITDLPTNVSFFTNDAGYLTTYNETDPVFTASPAGGIIAGDITNWNLAVSWGDHASAGYALASAINLQTVLDTNGYATSPNTNNYFDMDISNAAYFDFSFYNGTDIWSEIFADEGYIWLNGANQVGALVQTDLEITNGVFSLKQTSGGIGLETNLNFVTPTANTTLRFPAKSAGSYVLATTTDYTLDSVTDNNNTTTNQVFLGKVWTSDIQNNDTGWLEIRGNQGIYLIAHNPNDGNTNIGANGAIASVSNGETVWNTYMGRLYNDSLVNTGVTYVGLEIADTVNMTNKTGGSSYQALRIDPAVSGSNTLYAIYSTAGDVVFTDGDVTAASFIKSGGLSTQFLKADGSVDSNTYITSYGKGAVTIELYNGGSDLTTGIKDTPVKLPYSGTVTGWEIMAYDASNVLLSTSCVVDILSDTFANLPLAGTDSIAGTEKPTLTAASTNSDSTITTWSTLTENNYIQAEIESVSAGVKKIVISIKVNRTS